MTTRPNLPQNNLLSDLNPFFYNGAQLPNPEETLDKLEALMTTLLCVQDDEDCSLLIDPRKLAWALDLAHDLVKEAQKRTYTLQDNVATTWRETTSRIEQAREVLS